MFSRQTRAMGFAAMTIVFWSTAATAFKLTLAHIDFMLLVFYAALTSMIVLALLCIFTGRIGALREWQSVDYRRSGLLGLLNPGLYYMLLFQAYTLLPAQEAQVLNFTWPIVLTLLGVIFLGQRLGVASVIAIAVSFFGVAMVATRGDVFSMQFSNTTGVILALSSTLAWGAYWLVNQTDKQDPLLRLLVNFIAGTLWIAVLISLLGAWALPSVKAVFGAIYIGMFEMSLAFFCWFQALRLAKHVSMLNNMIFLTPFGALLVIWLVLREPIFPSTIIGLLIISGSIIFQRWALKGTAHSAEE